MAKFCVAAALGLGSAIVVGGAAAAADMKSLVENANLIVRTRVANVEFMTGGPGGLPYTIVTFDVQKAARSSVSKSIVMRFLGGPDGQGGVTEVSTAPIFQKGDEDILFVNNNGQNNGCPLVDCVEGRFRILKGVVYDGHGAPLRSLKNDEIVANGVTPKEFLTVRYPAPKFDELMKNPEARAMLAQRNMPMDMARQQYEANKQDIVMTLVPGDAGKDGPSSLAPTAAAATMTVDAFMGAIGAKMQTARAPAGSFASFNKQAASVAAAAVLQTAAPGAPAIQRATAPRSAGDAEEERRLPKDDSATLPRKGQ